MKIIFAVLSALASSLSSWGANPSGLIEYTLHSRDFDRVYVSGRVGVDLCVKPDSAGYIVVQSTSAAYEALNSRHSDGTLYLSVDDRVPADLSAKIKLVRVYVDSDLSAVSATGLSKVSVDGAIVNDNPVTLMVNGQAVVSASAIQSDAVSLSVTGAGRVDVTGPVKADNVNCSTTGSGHISVSDIDSETISATLRGSGSVTVAGRVRDNAAVVVKGSGTIDTGNLAAPLVKASVFGTGDIIYNDKSTLRASGKINQIKKSR